MLAPPGRIENVRGVHTSEELFPDLIFTKVLRLFIEGRGALSYGVLVDTRGAPDSHQAWWPVPLPAEPFHRPPETIFFGSPPSIPRVRANFTVAEQSGGDVAIKGPEDGAKARVRPGTDVPRRKIVPP